MWWMWVPPEVSTFPGHQLTWARIMCALVRMKPNEARNDSRMRKCISFPAASMCLSYASERSCQSASTCPEW
jgi:hypothetical protein